MANNWGEMPKGALHAANARFGVNWGRRLFPRRDTNACNERCAAQKKAAQEYAKCVKCGEPSLVFVMVRTQQGRKRQGYCKAHRAEAHHTDYYPNV